MRRIGLKTVAAALAVAVGSAFPAWAQSNQTPTTTPISLDEAALPYKVTLRRVSVDPVLPTLQSFALGQVDGLWVLVGGRTNGLHNFTNDPIKNFPPSAQNDRVWVIDPTTWESWSRPWRQSSLTTAQQDELSSTAQQGVQVGDVLYVVGGYGFDTATNDFATFRGLTAIDLPKVVAWVRRERGQEDPGRFIRQAHARYLQVTGGQLTIMNDRAVLAFGQKFTGGYGGKHSQRYTGQVRTFGIVDDGVTVKIADPKSYPETPNLADFRRRDYNMVPMIGFVGDRARNEAVALSGVFTVSGGIWTVPVEIDPQGKPRQADPAAAATFKQGMNSYNTANLTLFDSETNASHALMFGGISYIDYRNGAGFVASSDVPFVNDTTAIVRAEDRSYSQTLLRSATYPRVTDASGARLLFGAEAGLFLKPDVPTIGNGLVDLRATLARSSREQVIGWIFGGIAAEKPNFGASAASNVVFEIRLAPN